MSCLLHFFVPRKKQIFLSKRNEKAIEDFIENDLIPNRSDNENTVKNYRESIKRVLNLVRKDFNKLTIQELNRAFSKINGVTKELIKTKFRVFLRYHNLNDLADKIKPKFSKFSEPTKTDEDILTPEEIKILVNTPIKLRDRAICELFIISGCSRVELAKLKIGNVKVEDVTIWLSIHHGKSSHTNRKHRKIPIVTNHKIASALKPKNFLLWLEQHPYKNDYDKPVFYSDSRNNLNNELHPITLNNILTKANKDSGIKRKITPHILRHTGATYDGIYFNRDQLNLKYGWKASSKMANRYVHQNVEHLNQKLKELAGYTEDRIEKETICPNCQEKNHINANRCKKCNHIFDREEAIRIAEEKDKQLSLMNRDLSTALRDIEKLKYENRKTFILLRKVFDISDKEIEEILEQKEELVITRDESGRVIEIEEKGPPTEDLEQLLRLLKNKRIS
jgi:integrase/recombinase XerD